MSEYKAVPETKAYDMNAETVKRERELRIWKKNQRMEMQRLEAQKRKQTKQMLDRKIHIID